MTKATQMTRVYFSHDQDSRDDDKIKELFFSFRKLSKTLERQELEELAAISGYAIFWSILEYMHRNSFQVKDIELLSDSLRIEPKFVEKVLNDFKLFIKNDDEYISLRLQKDIKQQNEKSSKRRKAVEIRWLLSFYDEAYNKEFGIIPTLDDEEIETLYRYSETIDDFRKILPDILYTLTFIKFDGKTKFEPKSNWLLKGNNLARVYHGEFGPLKHKKTPAEIKAEQALQQPEDDYTKEYNSISTKVEAIELINKYINYIDTPPIRNLMKRFDIQRSELCEK